MALRQSMTGVASTVKHSALQNGITGSAHLSNGHDDAHRQNNTSRPTLAFCGLGAMGSGMACNLARLGFEISGFDMYRPLVDKLVASGGKASDSPAAACRSVEVLILMVVNAAQVSSVVLDPKTGAVGTLPTGATIIVCSTCPPSFMSELRSRLDDEAKRPDIRLLDCPVSGGSLRAAAGTLSIFASGDDGDLDKVSEVLNAMSQPLYRIPGGLSFGSISKLCHQHQAAVNIITASEAMGVAAAAGLNTRNVYERINASIGRSWFLENRGPHMLEDDFLTVHSAVSIILKDAIIVTDYAREQSYPLILANVAQQLYIAGVHAGLTKEDDAGLVRLFLKPGNKKAVARLADEAPTNGAGASGLAIEDVMYLMAGIHLASTLECVGFAKSVGMDIKLLYDIVTKGAGQSTVWDKVAQWSISHDGGTGSGISGFDQLDEIRRGLEMAVRKANEIQQPCPMGAAALQALLLKSL